MSVLLLFGGSVPNVSLVIAEASHTLSNDAIATLLQDSTLAVSQSFHSLSNDSIALTENKTLAIAEAVSAHLADTITFPGGNQNLVIQEAFHGLSNDPINLLQNQLLVISESFHAVTNDAITSLVQNFTLTIAEARSLHSSDPITTLVQNLTLTIAEARHTLANDVVSLIQNYVLTIAESFIAVTNDSVTLSLSALLIIQEAFHSHIADDCSLWKHGTAFAQHFVPLGFGLMKRSSTGWGDDTNFGKTEYEFTTGDYNGTLTIYFEAYMRANSGETFYARISDQSNNAITNSEISTSSTTMGWVRSQPISLSGVTKLHVEMNPASTSGNNYLYRPRLVIMQAESTRISKLASYCLVTTSTCDSAMGSTNWIDSNYLNSCLIDLDDAYWDGTLQVDFCAVAYTTNATATCSVRLVDSSHNEIAILTTTSTTPVCLRSNDIFNGKTFDRTGLHLEVKTSSVSYQTRCVSAYLIFRQSGTCTKSQLWHEVNPQYFILAGTSSDDYDNYQFSLPWTNHLQGFWSGETYMETYYSTFGAGYTGYINLCHSDGTDIASVSGAGSNVFSRSSKVNYLGDITPGETVKIDGRSPSGGNVTGCMRLIQRVSLYGSPELSVSESFHTLSNDIINLAYIHVLSINEGLHALSNDALSLGQVHILNISEGLHNHYSDSLSLIFHYSLVISECHHAHLLDQCQVNISTMMAIQRGFHSHFSDNIILSEYLALKNLDSVHSVTDTFANLIQAQILGINESRHTISDDFANFLYVLVINNAKHLHSTDTIIISTVSLGVHDQWYTVTITQTLDQLGVTVSKASIPEGDTDATKQSQSRAAVSRSQKRSAE